MMEWGGVGDGMCVCCLGGGGGEWKSNTRSERDGGQGPCLRSDWRRTAIAHQDHILYSS